MDIEEVLEMSKCRNGARGEERNCQTDPLSRQSICRIRDKFDETDAVKKAPKFGRLRNVVTIDNEESVTAPAESGIQRISQGRLVKKTSRVLMAHSFHQA